MKIRVRAYYAQNGGDDEGYVSVKDITFGGTYWPAVQPSDIAVAAVAEAPDITVTGMRATLESSESCEIEENDRTCVLRRGSTDEELMQMVSKGMTRFVSDNN